MASSTTLDVSSDLESEIKTPFHSRPQSLGSPTQASIDEYDEYPSSKDEQHSLPATAASNPTSSPGSAQHDPSHPGRPPPPPDGGLTAWLQVLGGYFLFMNTWGIINAFGVFQTYYSEDLLAGTSNSNIAWIGTLTSFLLCASPLTWGPIFDRGNVRILIFVGVASVALGIMMTSLCHAYWQLMLAQGICVGLGGGCLFLTGVSILPSYFAKRRALAMGLAASGSSLGGILYPIIFHQLQPRIGFPWAVRIIGFIAVATLAIPCAVIQPPGPKPPGRRKLLDLAIMREVPFEIFNLATFLGFVGQYIPFFFIEQYAGDHGLGLAFWMLIFLNLGSIPGRILPGLVADLLRQPLLVLAACTAAAAVLAFCWVAIRHSTAGLAVWAVLYGFTSGAFVSLQGAAVSSMAPDMSSIGTRFGINMFCGALGILIGSPVGGAIFPVWWPGAQIFCGLSLALSAVAVLATYFVFHAGKRTAT